MKRHSIYTIASLVLLDLSFGPALAQQPPTPAVPTPTAQDGIDVQTRGAVHEAFAEPYSPDPQPTPVVPRQPPPPIPEQPPDEKPAGENVQWIPGYWSWDTDRNDFTWVSGCWRVPPPGREWAPGSWTQVDGGWRWVPGMWKGVGQPELVLQEPPPASLENGPSTPAPNDNSFYVPGCWVNHDNRYLWRPGFWHAFQPDWVWTDAQYSWTPQGCVFTDGYWDYGLEDRGVPFAPAVFTEPLWDTPGWCYRPGYAIGWDGLLGSLFARPGYGQYYFGDYYDARYRRAGFAPWHLARGHLRDSLFDYARWQHRGDRGWYAGVVNGYRGRLQGTSPRPPRTFAEQARLLRQGRDVRGLRMVSSVREFRGDVTRFRGTAGVARTSRRVDVQSVRDVSRARSVVDRSAASRVHESAHAVSAAARPLPRPQSHYAAAQRPSAPRAAHEAQAGPHGRAIQPAQAHGYVAAASGAAGRPSPRPAAAHPAARPQQARGYAAARPGSATARQPASRSPQARQPRQVSRSAAAPRAAAASRRTASPRPASQPHYRPAAPRAPRAAPRPAPRAGGRSGSAHSGKHR